MSLRYTLTTDDLVAFNVYHTKHSPLYRWSQFFLRFMVVLIASLMWLTISTILILGIGSTTLVRGFVFGGSIAGAYLMYHFLIATSQSCPVYAEKERERLRSNVKEVLAEGKENTRTTLGAFTLSWSEEGLKETGEFGESSWAWAAINKIAVTDRYIFVYTSAVTALIIPLKDTPDNGAALLAAHKQFRPAVGVESDKMTG